MAKKNLFSYMETLSEMFGWVVIVLSFIALGVGGYFLSAYLIKGTAGNVIGALGGLIIIYLGIRIANKAYKGKGTIFVLSRTIASPELDDKKEDSIE